MDSTVSSFLNYIMCERNYSDYTVKNYREDLLQYEDFVISLTGSFNPFSPDMDLARAWMAEMAKRKLKTTTIKRRLCTLRSYYKFLRREKLIDTNPYSLLPSPKVNRNLPVWATELQMDFLIDEEPFGSDYLGKRDHLLIVLIYSTGMRRSEVANLKTIDVDYGNKTIRVFGKGNKIRLVPFGDELQALLRELDEEKKRVLGKEPEYIITDECGGGLTPIKIAKIVHKYLSSIPTLAKQTTHVLRHSFATNMLANGADLMAVKELLGHASLQSTEVYTHLTPREILINYHQAHPRAKKGNCPILTS